MSEQSVRDVAEKLDRLSSGDLVKLLRKGFIRAGTQALAGAVSNARERMGVRTGHLSRSIQMRVDDGDGTVSIILTADTPYAKIQEEGGQVRPVRRKYLRIPLAAALTAAGVDRLPTSLYQSAPDQFFVSKSKKGTLLLRDRETGVPWYALIKGPVTITPKFYLQDAGSDAMKAWVDTLGATVAAELTSGATL